MRIPWYYSVPACLLVFFTVLYFGARGYDFTEEPSEQKLEETREKWHASHPPLAARETPIPAEFQPKPPKPPTPEPQPQPEPTPPEPQPQPRPDPPNPPEVVSAFEDIDTAISPSLDHFSDIPASTLPKLAKHLEEKKHPELARLAWERVLESKDTSSEDKSNAASAIKSLRAQTSRWNPDSTTQISLTFEISVSSKIRELADAIRPNLIANISQFSGGIIKPTIIITSITPKSGFPPPPSSLTIKGKSGKTTTLRFTSPSATKDSLSEQFYAAIYNTVRNQIKKQDTLHSPEALPTQVTPKQAVANHITRLTWKTFAQSLTK